MVGVGEHKISAVAIAIIDLFFFGLGFARVSSSSRRARGESTCASR